MFSPLNSHLLRKILDTDVTELNILAIFGDLRP